MWKSSNIAEISINKNVYSDPKHIAEHLNDFMLTLAQDSPLNPNFYQISMNSHSNLTDVNSKFYFRMIAELKYSNHLAILSFHP